MSEQQVSLRQLLKLEGKDGTYTAHISELWSQGRAGFGGLVAAQLARALEQVVPPERTLRSALIDFIAPASPGEVTITRSVLRTGRALTHGEARMHQGGAVVAVFIGTYGVARSTQLHHTGQPAFPTAPPEQLPRLPYVEGMFPRFTQFFEFRLSGTQMPFSGSEQGKVGGYVRHEGGGPNDTAGILALLDAWPPAVLPLLKKPAPASSVTWMVDLLGTPAATGSESNDFFRYEAETVAAQDGYGSCEARLWGPDGALLAASRQMVVEFS